MAAQWHRFFLSCLGFLAFAAFSSSSLAYGLTGGHTLFTYTHASGWVGAPSARQSTGGYPLMHISVISASRVLVLNTAAYPNNVYLLNSTKTAWQPISGWLSLAEIGPDGSMWGINLNNSTIYNWTGATWSPVQGILSNIAVGGTGGIGG